MSVWSVQSNSQFSLQRSCLTDKMKLVTCEIAWHNKEPVYSLDFQHSSDGRIHRLATAGVDTAVRVRGQGKLRLQQFLMCVHAFVVGRNGVAHNVIVKGPILCPRFSNNSICLIALGKKWEKSTLCWFCLPHFSEGVRWNRVLEITSLWCNKGPWDLSYAPFFQHF